MILDTVKTIWYFIWKIILAQPYIIKIILEAAFVWILITLISFLLLFLINWILIPFLRIFLYIILEIFQLIFLLLNKIFKRNIFVRADELFNSFGIRSLSKLDKIRGFFSHLQVKRIALSTKWLWIAAACLILLVVPYSIKGFFHLPYSNIIAFFPNKLSIIEEAITPDIENYPDIFIASADKSKDAESQLENVLTLEIASSDNDEDNNIYLRLNQDGVAGSRVRTFPGFDSDTATVVYDGDQILYLGDYNLVEGRYWLHVVVKDDIEGWISHRLILNEDLLAIGINP